MAKRERDFQRLAGLGVPVLVDEVYRDFLGPDAGPVAARYGEDMITTGSLTKVYGLGGLRLGWILARPLWIERMRRAAENPRVSMKVSALMEHCSEQPAPTAVDLYRPAFETMWELFGGDRLFFGSNWPVCERAGTYARCLQIARALLAERSESEQAAFFHENAARIYGLSARS